MSNPRSTGRPLRAWLAAAFFVVASSLSLSALAGNLDAFYLSGDAALEGGAITATASGGGAIWYNPAGLANLEGARLDVSMNAYAVRFGGSPDLRTSSPDANVERLSRTDLNVVPSGLSLTHRLGRFGVGFGVFVPTQATYVLRTLIREPDGLVLSTDFYERLQEYHLGPSLGWSPTDDWRFGASMLFNYRTLFSTETFSASGSIGGTKFDAMTHGLQDWVQLGAEFVVGTQWTPSESWAFGARLRTPAIRLLQINQTLESSVAGASAADMGTTESESSLTDDFGIAAAVLTPFRFHLGAAHSTGSYRLSVVGSVLLPFIDEELNVNGRSTWNARLGLKKALDERWTIGGGLFTDLSPEATLEDFGDSQINFYGVTIAADLQTRYAVVSENGVTRRQPAQMGFGTTVGLSYALGLGKAMNSQVALDADEGLAISNYLSRVTAHEFTLYVSSSFSE